MQKRPLGRTGFEVNPIGLGTWGTPGTWWRGVDIDESRKALRCAIERGVNFIDTALVYGDGGAEQMVGEAIRDTRSRDYVWIASKVPPADMTWPGRAQARLRTTFPAEHIMKSVEASLRNTRADTIHLMQLHVWHDAWLADDEWPRTRAAMDTATKQGKVLHWGISANDVGPDDACVVLQDPIIQTVQCIYNVFDRRADKKLFSEASKYQVGVIARCPFDEGALTGSLGSETTFHPDDWRNRYFTPERLGELESRIAELAAWVEERPGGLRAETVVNQKSNIDVMSLSELALRFAISHDSVGVAIPGARQTRHVKANMKAGERGPLNDALLHALAPVAWDKNWYA